MDCVQRPERWLRERTCGREQAAVEGKQRNRIEELARAGNQRLERQARIVGGCPSDRARQLGEDKLAGDDVGVSEEGAQRLALRLLADQLDERRGVRVEERTQWSPRISSSARLSACGSPSR